MKRNEIFLGYLKHQQLNLTETLGRTPKFIYISSASLRIIYGNHKYKESIDALVKKGVVSYYNSVTTKFKHRIYNFSPLRKKKLDSIRDLTINDYKELPRFKNIIGRLSKCGLGKHITDMAYISALENFDTILLNGEKVDIFAKVDRFSGRLHTSLTRMPSEERKKCTIDGNKLSEIDVATCQPTLLSYVLEQAGEGQDFINVVRGGDIYEYIREKCSLSSRDQAKKEYYRIFYGHTKAKGHQTLKELFPQAYRWINEKKTTYYTGCNPKRLHVQISKIMQEYEVSLFKHIWISLAEQGVKFVTCHDAIYCDEDQKELARDIMLQVFEENGINAKLHVK